MLFASNRNSAKSQAPSVREKPVELTRALGEQELEMSRVRENRITRFKEAYTADKRFENSFYCN